jgi:hypothetical protein
VYARARRGKPQPPADLVAECLAMLAWLITSHTDEEVLTDACWALSYLSDGSNENIKVCARVCVSVSVRARAWPMMHYNYPCLSELFTRRCGET